MANLVALYTAWKGSGICPATLDILIIVPAPCCFMTGITASMDSTAPNKLVSNVAQLDIAACRDTFDTNFFGAVESMLAVIPVIKHQGAGTFIYISRVVVNLRHPS